MFKSDDSQSSGEEVRKKALSYKHSNHNFSNLAGEYVDILTDDDVPTTEKFKANFKPLEVLSEVFYQVTNFSTDSPVSNIAGSSKKYSFKRKNFP